MIVSRYRNARVASPLLPIAAAVMAFFASLSGCSTIPPAVLAREPSSLLEAVPQLYLRFSGVSLRDIARGFDKEELGALAAALGEGGGSAASSTMDTTILEGFLARTQTFGAGMRGIGTSSPAMEAVFIGDFPVMSVRLALAFDGNWVKTDEGGYQSKKYPIFLRTPQPGLIHASSIKAPLLATLPDKTGIAAYPPGFAPLATSDIFIAANDPAIFFAGTLPLEATSIPIGSIIIAGRRLYDYPSASSPLTEPRYLLDIYIQMKDESTAKAYKPVVRFIWTAAIGKFFGGNLNANASPLTLEKDVYVVRNIETDAAALRTMIRSSLVRK